MVNSVGRPKVAVDIDGVVCDLSGAIRKRLLGEGWTVDETVYPWADEEWFLRNSDIYLEGKPIQAALEGLKELKRSYEVVFVTRRPKEAEEYTLRWLDSAGFGDETVIFTTDKGRTAKGLRVLFAIEDGPEDILSYRRENVPVCIVNRPYNLGLPSDLSMLW